MAGAFDAGSIFGRLTLDLNEWSANIEKAKADTSSLAGLVASKKDDIEKLGKAFTAVGVAITGALGLCVKSAMDYTLEIGRMSVKTGIATETLSGLQQAADKSGMSLDELGVGMKRFGSLAFDASQGSSAAVETLKRLGISATDTSGKLKPMDQLLMETADKFKAMPNGVEKSALAVDLFGRSGTTMIAMLNRGSEGIRGFTDEAREAGMIITSEGVAKAKAFNYSLKDLDDAFMGVKLAIANALMPVVKTLANAFTFVVIEVRKVLDIFPPLGNTVAIVVGAFGLLMAILGPMLLLLPKLTAAWTMIAEMLPIINARLVTLKMSLGFVVGAFGAAVLAIQATIWIFKEWNDALDESIDKIYTAAQENKRNWGFISEVIHGSNEKIKASIQAARVRLSEIGYTAEEVGNIIYKQFQHIVKGAEQVKVVTLEMARSIDDVLNTLIDKTMALTKNEYEYRIWQAQQYYAALKAKIVENDGDERISAAADRALALEISKIKQEQAEAQADAHKAMVEKKKKADAEYLKDVYSGEKDVATSWQQVYLQMQGVAQSMTMQVAQMFGVTFGKITSQGPPAMVKVESAFQKSMKKIDGYLSIVQQGFGQFFQALQSNSDSYYKKEFARIDKLFQKQKDALSKSYNAKIAELDAKDAAEALANQRKEIMMSNMTAAEKAAALAAIDTEQKKIAERQKIEKEYADAQAKLELEQTATRRQLERQQAEANKKSAIVQAVINMATAITASWKLGFPLGAFAAAIAAAACLIQINAIKKQPIPEMAEGGLVNRPTTVLAGEAGPEAILPIRELQRMLGTGPGRKKQAPTMSISIKAFDAVDVLRVTRKTIIPEIRKAMDRESLRVPAHAIGY